MSESKQRERRKQRFLAKHSRCCFCGGARASSTVDHVPARICFKNKIGPEGFEFPACETCNSESSLSELVSALYVRMIDADINNLDAKDIVKILGGLDNNARHLIPALETSANEIRRHYRDTGLQRPLGMLLSETPVLHLPLGVNDHISVFAKKLLYAIYFKESGDILDNAHGIILMWAQIGTPAYDFSRSKAGEWFGEEIVSGRVNTDIGNQFSYRVGYNKTHGFLGLWAEFGQSLGFFCMAGPADKLASAGGGFVQPYEPLDFAAKAAKAKTREA